MNQRTHSQQRLRQLPTKWALAILGVVILYALGQPLLNRQFGWKLPSVTAILGEKSDKPPAVDDRGDSSTRTSQVDPTIADDKSDSELRFGLLKDIGRDRYQSPAGLIWGPGSEEGHRIDHIRRHLKDQPNRPGKHGVFDGDMPSVIRWIDDAYQRAMNDERTTSKHNEDRRTVIEASFEKPIGYIGGRDGKRLSNPASKRLRLVVEGKSIITAFPI